jgi:hypothetical protein
MRPVAQLKPEDLRRHQRVKVSLLGRYMLSDRREFPCQTIDMSPGGLALTAPVCGAFDERVVVYLDHIGRLEGRIIREIDNGFAMSVSATARKREKLADQLTWIANQQALGLPEDRRHERASPRNTRSLLTLADGREYKCQVVDVSLSGAAVHVEIQPPLGSPVTLGRTQSRVVRHFEGGIAVEFSRAVNEEVLQQQFG